MIRFILALLTVWFSIFPFVSFAQEATNLGDILIRFCNGVDEVTDIEALPRVLQLETEAWKQEEICVAIWNGGETPVTVTINFVDWTITNDADQKRACGSEWSKSKFGQFVTAPETAFDLDPNNIVTTRAQVSFPDWFAWSLLGCLTAQLEVQEENTWWDDSMFKIQTRRASFIEVSVAWEINVNLSAVTLQESSTITNLSDNDSFFVFKDITDWNYKWMIKLTNASNVSVEATITPVFTDMMWNVTPLEEQTTLIPLGESRDIFFLIDEHIPFYKWKFNLSANVSYEAKTPFKTDADLWGIEQFSLEANTLLIPWMLLWWSIVVIILLWIIIGIIKRRRKRYREIMQWYMQHQQQQQ